ncbi:MAG: transcription elongation factor GreAB [Desulfuromonas sp.]|nr:MAG: transcription elongation factor GreAB [Desulfuromonas sp.]
MNKQLLLQQIIATLEADLVLFSAAAKAAHQAATHEQCQPDNKYDTTALEASYVAQGQANRAAEIRGALDCYRSLELQEFDDTTPVRLTALVTLEDTDGDTRRVFLGPEAGGMKIDFKGERCVVVTPEAPLGRALLGKLCDDEVEIGAGKSRSTYLLTEVI